MPFEITMPQLGLTMETGSVVKWLVKEGDQIAPGQEIFEVETDKATVAVEAHQEGSIARILVPLNEEVPVGTTLAVLVAPGEVLPPDWQPAVAAPVAVPGQAEVSKVETRGARPLASWKARTLARQAGLDLERLPGSGPDGRIVAKDVIEALARPAPPPEPERPVKVAPLAAKLATQLGLDLSTLRGSGPQGRITQADVLEMAAAIIRGSKFRPVAAPGPARVASTTPLTGVRKIVSERMATSAQTAAQVTLWREVDATALVELYERFKARSLRVSYNDILVRVCAVALQRHPKANARIGEGRIEQLEGIHIGLAVDTDRGLLVPVIHNADRLTIPQIATESTRLIEAAKAGHIQPDDLTGGTFTLTNLGMFGVEGFTPIINLPECCILGVGRIVRKVVVCDPATRAAGEQESDGDAEEAIAVRPMMILSLVFDHRVIDGAPAARFLDHIAQLVQEPRLML